MKVTIEFETQEERELCGAEKEHMRAVGNSTAIFIRKGVVTPRLDFTKPNENKRIYVDEIPMPIHPELYIEVAVDKLTFEPVLAEFPKLLPHGSALAEALKVKP